ncbi:MAG: DUF6206 family protein [Actinomycetota bacterium]
MSDGVSDPELLEVENALLDGFVTRRTDGVDVLGFGETGVALSWPRGDGRLVLKRVVSVADETEAEEFAGYLRDYVEAMSAFVTVAPTQVRTLRNRDDRVAIYLAQPRFAAEVLLETIMEVDEPSADHPAVRAVVDAALRASETGRLGIDAQFQNFAWIEDELVLFDVGTPFVFEADGSYALDTSVVGRVMPAFMRMPARRKYEEVVCDIGSRRGSLQQAAMSLVRVGQERWLPAVLEMVNPHLDEPLDHDAVVERAAHLHRQSAGLKRLMKLERWWSTRVRRRPYDMFITDSFTGELQ